MTNILSFLLLLLMCLLLLLPTFYFQFFFVFVLFLSASDNCLSGILSTMNKVSEILTLFQCFY